MAASSVYVFDRVPFSVKTACWKHLAKSNLDPREEIASHFVHPAEKYRLQLKYRDGDVSWW